MEKNPYNNLEKAKRALRLNKFGDAIFPTETAIKVCHMPYRRFSDWDRKGVLPHQKRGSIEGWRTFSFHDLLVIKAIALLRENGVPVLKIKKMYDWLNGKEGITGLVKHVLREDIYIATDLKDAPIVLLEKDFGDAVRLAQPLMLAFKLRPILDELLKDLEELEK